MRKSFAIIYTFLCLAAALGAESCAIDEESLEPLTLEAAFRIALDNSPMNRAASEGVVVAREAVGIARAPYYPDVGLNAHYRRFRNFFFFPNAPILSSLGLTPVIGPENDWNLDVSGHYLLYDFGKRRAQLDAALAEQNIAREEECRIRQQILLNVALAFHSYVASMELYEVAIDTLKRAKAHHEIAKSRNEVGDVPSIDVYRAQVEMAQGERGLVRSRNQMRIAAGNLNTAMGLPPQMEFTVVPELTRATSPEKIDLCEALERSVCSRPEVKQALGRITSSCSRVDEAKSEFGPRIHAQGLYGKRQNVFFPKQKEWAVAIEFELSLFRGFEDMHRVRRAKHSLSKERAEYEQVLLDVRQDVWNAHSSLLEAYELIQTAAAEMQDSRESLRLAEERYKVGSSTINDLLDSQTAYARSQADYVGSEWQYRSAEAQFQWAQGALSQ